MSKNIEDVVEEIVREFVAPPIELVDVEYVKEHDWYLRIYIDKEGGIDIEDCRELSEKVEKILDRDNVIADSYILEVSSPGIDRILRKPRDYEREQGKLIDVSLYAPRNGSKLIIGELAGYDGKVLKVGSDEIPVQDIAQVRLHIEF